MHHNIFYFHDSRYYLTQTYKAIAIMRYLILILLVGLGIDQASASRSVNVYVWGGEIPKQVIAQFEVNTGIKVNFSTYDSNETLFAKLRASKNSIYDVILPSSYFVERMHNQGMLLKLDRNQLSNLKHLDPLFTNNKYDPKNRYSVPLIWGATGIFYNQTLVSHRPDTWNNLWESTFTNKLLLLDDAREVFAIALMSLGYPPDDVKQPDIKKAYEKLLTLVPNIKLFSSEGIQAILIDEDAVAGLVWNGDAFKAHAENKQIQFIYPKDGFVIWVDCLAIPANAAHISEAYAFINFLLRPEVAANIGLTQGHGLTNATGKAMLPLAIRNNTMIYPSLETLAHGHFQGDPGEETMALFNQYWQELKLAF